MHVTAPAALVYVPAGQEAHVADEVAPAALEYVPAGQEVHVDAPASDEYLPAHRQWGVSAKESAASPVLSTHPPRTANAGASCAQAAVAIRHWR